MKKLAAFIGSPRQGGNTATLVGEIVKGAQAAGATAKVYCLNEMNIKPCQSCFHCRQTETCGITGDDMAEVYQAIKEADGVVIGSPVYMYQVTAQTKLLLDRLFPLMDINFNPRFGSKKTNMVYAQGNPDAEAFKSTFAATADVLAKMGLKITDTIAVAGANDPQTAFNNAKLMTRAYQAGQKLFSCSSAVGPISQP